MPRQTHEKPGIFEGPAVFNMNSNVFYIHQKIKPLSVNKAWRGRRYKTKEYLNYEKRLIYEMPKKEFPIYSKYYIVMFFYFSSGMSDWDNPIKPIQDILQKKYGFNDKDVYIAHIVKKITTKSNEGLSIYIGNADDFISDVSTIMQAESKG